MMQSISKEILCPYYINKRRGKSILPSDVKWLAAACKFLLNRLNLGKLARKIKKHHSKRKILYLRLSPEAMLKYISVAIDRSHATCDKCWIR